LPIVSCQKSQLHFVIGKDHAVGRIGFVLWALVWGILGGMLVAFSQQCQLRSKRFEQGESLIPFPPIGGVPVWTVRLFGIIAIVGAALFVYLFFYAPN
jgi:hypothetical protein